MDWPAVGAPALFWQSLGGGSNPGFWVNFFSVFQSFLFYLLDAIMIT